MGRYSFKDYQEKITFLQAIPASIASKLSVNEFYFPNERINAARKALETVFDHHVMTYNAKIFNKKTSLETHLCANYRGARLTQKQIALLNNYEKKFQSNHVRFVVYQKPLQKISLKESPFYN